jgi:tRNA U34 5-carboxymethylaminomethyl modifying GTPase MnmE/TrmE
MKDKKETPVSWLVDQFDLSPDSKYIKAVIDEALEMESKKQQKYDEMLEMLEELFNLLEENQGEAKFYTARHYVYLKQLIKEAKKL